ncbi:MAG: M23 family metallopeptidase [Synergistaceae bacterium]|nr:M23 family metallopeptidase [Synergistaceae bacterium]
MKYMSKSMHVLIFLSLLFGSSDAAVTLHYKEESDIGQPFFAVISSDAPFFNPSVEWMGKVIPLDVLKLGESYRAYALLGGAVNRVESGTFPLVFGVVINEGGIPVNKSVDIKLRAREYPETSLKVAPKMINPPKSELKRIENEAKLTAKARAAMTPKKLWQTRAVSPLHNLVVTGSYGHRRVFNGVAKGSHSGVDLRAALGTKVYSIYPGKVILTGRHYFAGNSVYIDSGNGVVSAYFHLDSIRVKDGATVNAGDVIGKAGATGRVTGTHLHLSVFLSEQSVDPMGLLDVGFSQSVKSLKQISL